MRIIMRRFNFENIPNINETFIAPPEITNHLIKVLRSKEGQIIEASNGTGNIFHLEIINITPEQIFLKVLSQTQGKEIPLHAVAFIGELKSDAMDQSISLLAEHGIPKIIPFFSERSICKLDSKQIIKKQLRRQKIIQESIKKVGGLYTCTIAPTIPFNDIQAYDFSQKILFWEEENTSSSQLSQCDFSQEIAFIIGVEGGFSTNEIQKLLSWNFRAYSLGTKILRAPQAAASAATLIRYFTENLLI